MKKSTNLILLITILIMIIGNLAKSARSETSENLTCYTLDFGGLFVEVIAPTTAWPGDTINVTVHTQTSANIHVDFINLNFSCLVGNFTKVPLLNTSSTLENVDLDSGFINETRYEIIIPNDTLPGIIFGFIWYDWCIKGSIPDPHQHLPEAFPATFVEDKAYIELKEDYDNLESSYTSLVSNYSNLQEQYQELENTSAGDNNTTSLMYLFLITTGIFVVTTILLIVKQPKSIW